MLSLFFIDLKYAPQCDYSKRHDELEYPIDEYVDHIQQKEIDFVVDALQVPILHQRDR